MHVGGGTKISSSNDGVHLSLDKYMWGGTKLTSAEAYMHLQTAFNGVSQCMLTYGKLKRSCW